MVRRRGVPRRGGISGRRGSVQSLPENITPLATASPTSVHGRPIPHNSFQTTRFKFHSRLNRPIISANIMVILAKEEDKPSISVQTSPSQTQNGSEFQEDLAGMVYKGDDMQEVGMSPGDSAQYNSPSTKPMHPSSGIRILVDPLGSGSVGDGDNVADMWMSSPRQMDKDAPDSPHHV